MFLYINLFKLTPLLPCQIWEKCYNFCYLNIVEGRAFTDGN